MPATDEAVTLAVTAADAADDRKATDLAILEVADILAVVDLFLLATAASDRQLRAVVDRIEERLREDHDRRPLRREGTPASGWILLDFGDLVCHVFSTEQREYYALERLWGDVPRRDPSSGERQAAPGAGTSDRQVDADLVASDVAPVAAGWLDADDADDDLDADELDELRRLEAEVGDDGEVADADVGDAEVTDGDAADGDR